MLSYICDVLPCINKSDDDDDDCFTPFPVLQSKLQPFFRPCIRCSLKRATQCCMERNGWIRVCVTALLPTQAM